MMDIAHNECISKSISFSILFFLVFDVCEICIIISPSFFRFDWNEMKSYVKILRA